MGKRRCRECGEQYEDSFRYCPVCGAEAGRRIARCRECGSRLRSGSAGRCQVCGARQLRLGWVKPLFRIVIVAAIAVFLGVTYVYSYLPQLAAPTPPVWLTPAPTATVSVAPTRTATQRIVPTPTRSRTPTATRVPPTPTKPPPVTYVVRFGDNLSSISDRVGVSIEAIMIANGLTDRELIREDQVLIIPTGTPTPPTPPTPTLRPQAPVTRLPIPTSTPER